MINPDNLEKQPYVPNKLEISKPFIEGFLRRLAAGRVPFETNEVTPQYPDSKMVVIGPPENPQLHAKPKLKDYLFLKEKRLSI